MWRNLDSNEGSGGVGRPSTKGQTCLSLSCGLDYPSLSHLLHERNKNLKEGIKEIRCQYIRVNVHVFFRACQPKLNPEDDGYAMPRTSVPLDQIRLWKLGDQHASDTSQCRSSINSRFHRPPVGDFTRSDAQHSTPFGLPW